MESDQEPVAALNTPRGTVEVKREEVRTQRHSNGFDGARPEHGALARHKYGLLEQTVDPAAAGTQGSKDNAEDITGTRGNNGREKGTGERNGQHAPIVHGQPEEEEEHQGTP